MKLLLSRPRHAQAASQTAAQRGGGFSAVPPTASLHPITQATTTQPPVRPLSLDFEKKSAVAPGGACIEVTVPPIKGVSRWDFRPDSDCRGDDPNDPNSVKIQVVVPSDPSRQREFPPSARRATCCMLAETSAAGLIATLARYVAADGRTFETTLLHSESGNPDFDFLEANGTEDNIYYRWKVYEAIMTQVSTPTFASLVVPTRCRMQRDGPVWIAPSSDNTGIDEPTEELSAHKDIETLMLEHSDAADELYASRGPRTGDASLADPEVFNLIVANLIPTRAAIRNAMFYAVEHADACRQIVSILGDHMDDVDALPDKALARFYLVSDILHNSAAPSRGSRLYRSLFRSLLPKAVRVYATILRQKAAGSQLAPKTESATKISAVFALWLHWSHIFPPMFVFGVELTFFLQLVEQESMVPLGSQYDPSVAADAGHAALQRDARLIGLDDSGTSEELAHRLAMHRRYVKHRTIGTEPMQALAAANIELEEAPQVVGVRQSQQDADQTNGGTDDDEDLDGEEMAAEDYFDDAPAEKPRLTSCSPNKDSFSSPSRNAVPMLAEDKLKRNQKRYRSPSPKHRDSGRRKMPTSSPCSLSSSSSRRSSSSSSSYLSSSISPKRRKSRQIRTRGS